MFKQKKESLQQRLDKAKFIFSKALADAEQINSEIQESINKIETQMQALREEIIELEKTQDESIEFINKLNQFV